MAIPREELVEVLEDVPKLFSAVLFGTATYQRNPRDIDLLLFLDGEEFQTPKESYPVLADIVRSWNDVPLDIQIRSVSELTTENIITFTPAFLRHLKNRGEVIYGSEDSLRILKDMHYQRRARPELSYGLSVRRSYLDSLLGEEAVPTKALYWNAADLLGIDLGKGETFKNLIRVLYTAVKLSRRRETIWLYNSCPENFPELVSRVERDAWAVNNYLLSQRNP